MGKAATQSKSKGSTTEKPSASSKGGATKGVRVAYRPIKNGFLVRTTKTTPSGTKKTEESFSDTEPTHGRKMKAKS